MTVYQFNPFDYYLSSTYSYTNDASLLLPTHVLGTTYYAAARQTFGVRRYNCTPYNFAMGYIPGFISVVGTQNSTTVSSPTKPILRREPGCPSRTPAPR